MLILFNVLLASFIYTPISVNEKMVLKAEKQIKKEFKEGTKLLPFNPGDLRAENLNSTFYFIENDSRQLKGIAVITHANGCVIGGCSINNTAENRYEQFYILSVYDRQNKLIRLNVLDYPGEHGYEITTKWWLKQFFGDISVKHKYGKNIDALGGATISARSVVDEVNGINSIIESISYGD